jgi:two-component system sensor histidine kinase AlgZ
MGRARQTKNSLHYGERLVFDISGNDAAVLQYECLPLLLQPLVENALRHDLDCHRGSGRIHLAFVREADHLRITLCNSVQSNCARNPGFGIGLAHTSERLQLAYGKDASMHSAMHADHFRVDILQPLHGG